MSGRTIARIFLIGNAQFSALTGLVLLFAAGWLADALLASPAGWAAPALRGLGVGLLLFAAMLVLIARPDRLRRGAVWIIVALDAAWIVATVAVVVALPGLLTPAGIMVAVAISMLVAFFGTGQAIGASRLSRPATRASVVMKDGRLAASVSRAVNAPVATVWNVMTDHPGYADVAGNIAKVEVIDGEGKGMRRRCFGHAGESWAETCNHFEPGRSYGFTVHTEADDYPYPISELTGKWSVDEEPGGSRFHIEILARPKGSLIKRLLFAAAAKHQFRKVLIDLADAWAVRMEREAAG